LTLVEWLQLQIADSGNFVDGNRWLDNRVVGTKLHLQEQSGGMPSVSLSASLSIPTAEAPG
jgi:hypothetical protein